MSYSARPSVVVDKLERPFCIF